LAKEHPQTVAITPAQRFLDALPVILEVGNLILPLLNADALGHLCSRLDDASNFVQDR
jgi:hypothetical protein